MLETIVGQRTEHALHEDSALAPEAPIFQV